MNEPGVGPGVNAPTMVSGPNVVEMTEAIAERQIQQVDQDEMAAMLDELRGLSPEEIKALLEAEG